MMSAANNMINDTSNEPLIDRPPIPSEIQVLSEIYQYLDLLQAFAYRNTTHIIHTWGPVADSDLQEQDLLDSYDDKRDDFANDSATSNNERKWRISQYEWVCENYQQLNNYETRITPGFLGDMVHDIAVQGICKYKKSAIEHKTLVAKPGAMKESEVSSIALAQIYQYLESHVLHEESRERAEHSLAMRYSHYCGQKFDSFHVLPDISNFTKKGTTWFAKEADWVESWHELSHGMCEKKCTLLYTLIAKLAKEVICARGAQLQDADQETLRAMLLALIGPSCPIWPPRLGS